MPATGARDSSWVGGATSFRGVARDCLAVDRFPSLKARKLLSILMAEPLGYAVVRQSGSHRRMEAPDHQPLTFAFHDRDTIPSGMVRKILVDQVGLDENDARRLL